VLEELHIRGLGVIEDTHLRLAPGLTVVTGETGAGKTMVVTALQLLLGMRADSSLVRTGAREALVEAVVDPAPPEAVDWHDEDEPLVAAREIPADGRSRARLGGRLAPVSALAQVLGRQVEVHAQHEHVRLAQADVQRGLLDRFAGDAHGRTLREYAGAFDEWRTLADRAEALQRDARERVRELERLRFERDEIAAAEIDVDADAAIGHELDRLAHAEELQRGAALASQALGSEGAGEPLGIAQDALRRLDVDDPELARLRGRLEDSIAEVADLAAEVRAYGEGVEADPGRLAALQDRQALLQGLLRKYGEDLPAVVAFGEQCTRRIEVLEADEADADGLDDRIAAARARVDELAGALLRGRQVAADRLAEIVDMHLADLGMPHARFRVEVVADGDAPGAQGADHLRFLLAANPGDPLRPLAQAASGGERSRVSLAIEVALADVDDARVLVFDEVDAGIGGATALAVGEKLARLAAGPRPRQVLCVTHLAQLASFADVHYVVEKGVAGGRTVTSARRVDEDDRPTELARMLGGDATAAAGLEHARELLAEAGRRQTG
jgi:DNA repair protein RecN (Recombination protein N)